MTGGSLTISGIKETNSFYCLFPSLVALQSNGLSNKPAAAPTVPTLETDCQTLPSLAVPTF